MRNWNHLVVDPDTSIETTIRAIDETACQFLLVVNADGALTGTVTDGDIRRGIIKSIPLTAPVSKIMQTAPKIAHPDDDRDRLLEIMATYSVRQLPIVDSNRHIVGLILKDEIEAPAARDNWVVLMAGGLGQRLRPLTETTPKPLLKIGQKPLLETILESFLDYNFRKFFISVNYRSEQLKEYFGDGSKWGVEIRYLEETEKLGTAGALGLMEERPENPFIVMNADLLTKVNFFSLLDFHDEQKSDATMCVREYDIEVPYGVVSIEDNHIVDIEEKPVNKFFVNAGIYVLNPSILEMIGKNSHLDMTSLFSDVLERKYSTSAFPIREYWLDIGRIEDFDKATRDFANGFDI